MVSGNGAGTYVFTGTGVPGNTVWVSVNGVSVGGPAVVQPNGTWSLSILTNVNPGDLLTAHSGSPTGPGTGVLTAGPAAFSGLSVQPDPLAGGANFIAVSGTAGQAVTVVDAVTGEILGSGVLPQHGAAAVPLANPAPAGASLRLVVNGLQGPLVTVGAPGAPPVLTQGVVLVEGSTLTGRGVPGASIRVIDDDGRDLGSTSVAGDGTWSVVVAGAVEGVGGWVTQNGVALRLGQKAGRLGKRQAFLSENIFRPAQGRPLSIGFKAQADGRVTVKIFNLAGERVRLLQELDVRQGVLYTPHWDGRNDFGEPCAAGVYVVSVQGGGLRSLNKVVLLK